MFKKDAVRLSDMSNRHIGSTSDSLLEALGIKNETKWLTRYNISSAEAIDVFGDTINALHWLNSECLSLGSKRPVELLDTDEGLQEVLDVLARIAYGIPS